jgi:putative transposase
MPGSFVCIYAHIVFGTKNRTPWLAEGIRRPVWEYMGAILRNHGCTPIEIGGAADHVHVLVELAKDRAVPSTVRDLKSNSARWMRSELPGLGSFSWQEGYSAFSVSVGGLEQVKRYIARQEEHHRRASFEDEMLEFLRRHGVEEGTTSFRWWHLPTGPSGA